MKVSIDDFNDLVNSLHNTTIKKYVLDYVLWEEFKKEYSAFIDEKKWKIFKYMNDDETINEEALSKIPSKKGGIYIYQIINPVLKDKQITLMYVGRALYTSNENLRKRVKEYRCFFTDSASSINRPKIGRAIFTWKKYVYCSYIPLDDNSIITLLEKELINKLLPPFNDEIPDTIIQKAVKAFEM